MSAAWISAAGQGYQRSRDGLLESAQVSPLLGFTLASGDEIEVVSRHRHEEVRDPLVLDGGIEVPVGRYTFHRAGADFTMPDGRRLRCNVSVEAGGFYDGYSLSASLTPAWNPSPHLGLSGEYRFDALRFPGRDASLDAHTRGCA